MEQGQLFSRPLRGPVQPGILDGHANLLANSRQELQLWLLDRILAPGAQG